VRDLRAVTPSLAQAFQVLTYVTNEVGYDPPGDAKGFLFWLPWFLHNTNSFVSAQDAHGAVWRGFAEFDCTVITGQQQLHQLLGAIFGPLGC
jgi:phospholipid/cholesterol/gamma-HCH transport system substrate-binding protein